MASVWPQPDALAHAGTFGVAMGTYLGGYLGARMDSGTAWGQGRLCTRVADFNVGAPDATVLAGGVHEGKRYAFVRREEIAEVGGASAYQRVDAVLFILPVTSVPTGANIGKLIAGGYGVVARVQSGTLVEPGAGVYDPVVYIDQPDGYAAYCVGNGAAQVDVVIERWNAGTRTELSRTTITPVSQSFIAPFAVRLELQNNGSAVDLTVSLKNVAAREGLFGMVGGRAGDVPTWSTLSLTNQYTEVASVSDSSGSRIATAGRSGFVCDKENRVTVGTSTVDTAGHCRVLEIATTGAVLIRDEWKRSAQVGYSHVGRWGDVCRNTACDWGYDRFSGLFAAALGTPYNGGTSYLFGSGFQGHPIELRGSTPGVQIVQPESSPAQEQFAVLAREIPNPTRARASIDFAHLSVGGSEAGVAIGIVLRASQVGNVGFDTTYLDNFAGYVFQIEGDGRCSIRRRQFAQNALTAPTEDDTVELASLTIAHTATTRELKAEVVNDDTPDPTGNQPVLLRMWIDGTQVLFATGTGDGVSVQADGTVRDAGQYRIQQASGVAVFAAFPATGVGVTKTVEVYETVLLTPTNPILPDSELASVSLRTEASNVVGTLPFVPSWSVPCEPDWERIDEPYVTGNAHKRPATSIGRPAWELGAKAVSDEDLMVLEDFYDAHGKEVPFNFQLPGEAAAVYRFVDRIEAEEHHNLYMVRFKIEQVHDA